MAATRRFDVDSQLASLAHELSRIRKTLMRSTAENAELCEAMAKLCRLVHESVGQSQRRLSNTARKQRHGDLSPALMARTTSSRRVAGLPGYRLRRVMDYIESSLAERVDVARLATVAGMSSGHFTAMFKRSTGMSPYQAVMRRRLARARDLLGDDSLTIAAISCLLGFSSQAHFTTAFRQVYGITPAAFRASERTAQAVLNQSWHSRKSAEAKSLPANLESHARDNGR